MKVALQHIPEVTDIRSLGYMIGIETTAPLATIVDQCRDAGLLVLTAGSNVIRLLPPLVLTPEEGKAGLAILKQVFASV